MEVEVAEESRELTNNVMCQLADPEGTPLGASMYLPQSVGPKELQQMVNKLLNNEEKLPYAFYISDQELVIQLGDYLQKKKSFCGEGSHNSVSTTSSLPHSSS